METGVAKWLVPWNPDQAVRFGPWPGHCVVFLGTTLYCHSVSIHPGVSMGTDEFTAGGNPAVN